MKKNQILREKSFEKFYGMSSEESQMALQYYRNILNHMVCMRIRFMTESKNCWQN